jgi:hypothetical protein
MRLKSLACNRLKETDFDRVAENSFTGIETSPKEILPLPAGRAAIGKAPPVLTMVPIEGASNKTYPSILGHLE